MSDTDSRLIDYRKLAFFGTAGKSENAEELFPLVSTSVNALGEIDREELVEALSGGENTRDRLIEFSRQFYQVSGEYKRLVQYFGNLMPCNYIVTPALSPSQLDEDAEAELEKVYEYVQSAAIQNTSSDIAISVVLEGAFYGVERQMGDSYQLQQLPGDYCRSRSTKDGLYTLEFDMSYFDQYQTKEEKDEALSQFPDEFATGFAEYEKDSQNAQWYFVEEGVRVHMLDNSALPLLAPVMLDILELDDYKKLDKVKAGLDIYKILVQKLPTDPQTGKMILEMQEVVDLHNNFRDKIENQAVDVLTTPAEVEAIDLADRSQKDTDNMEKALNMVYTAAGTPMMLFNSGGKTGTSIDRSITVDEALMLPLLSQYTLWYNQRFKELSNKVKVEIMFPPITVFNRERLVKLYTELAAQGMPTKLLAAACLDVSPEQFGGLLQMENELMNLTDKMEPLGLATALKTGGGDNNPTGESNPDITGKGAGRTPMQDDSQLSEEGRKTREQDKNTKYKGTTRKVMEE